MAAKKWKLIVCLIGFFYCEASHGQSQEQSCTPELTPAIITRTKFVDVGFLQGTRDLFGADIPNGYTPINNNEQKESSFWLLGHLVDRSSHAEFASIYKSTLTIHPGFQQMIAERLLIVSPSGEVLASSIADSDSSVILYDSCGVVVGRIDDSRKKRLDPFLVTIANQQFSINLHQVKDKSSFLGGFLPMDYTATIPLTNSETTIIIKSRLRSKYHKYAHHNYMLDSAEFQNWPEDLPASAGPLIQTYLRDLLEY